MSTVIELPTTPTVGVAVIRHTSDGSVRECDLDTWTLDRLGRFAAHAAPWRVAPDDVIAFTPCKATDRCDDHCTGAEACRTCDHPVCPDHDDHVIECVDGASHCDDGCRDRCLPCMREIGGYQG